VSPGFDPSTYIRWEAAGLIGPAQWTYLTGSNITITAQVSATLALQPGSIAGAQNARSIVSFDGVPYDRNASIFYGQLTNTSFIVNPATDTAIIVG
jgi:hypothetical protein